MTSDRPATQSEKPKIQFGLATVYLIFGSACCVMFCYANFIGWSIFDFNSVSPQKPTGPGQHYYHK